MSLLKSVLENRTKTEHSETRYQRVWFGVNARVTIGPGFLHKAGFGSVVIPHPPLVNWLLRLGLPEEARTELAFAHEFGHFQTAPLFLAYTIVLVLLKVMRGEGSFLAVFFLLISTQATWEIGSELRAKAADYQQYRRYYQSVTPIPRVIFWTAAIILTVLGWWVAIH